MNRNIRQRTLTGTPSQEPRDYEAPHAALSRKAAAEGFVLLKNDENVLPLPEKSSAALYGSGAIKTVKGGTGSGDVNERYSVNICEGMRNAGFTVANEDWIKGFEREYDEARLIWKNSIAEKLSDGVFFFDVYSQIPFHMPAGPEVTKADTDTAIYVLGRVAGEGADRRAEKGDYFIGDEEHRMLADVCRLYKTVIVLINTGGVVDLSFLDEFPNIKALMVISQPGMEGGNAVADVLSGKITPSGKLSVTWAYKYEDYPSAAGFDSHETDEYYNDGIYVGYRYFDTFGIKPRYAFGDGISYTSFDIAADKISAEKDGAVTVSVSVKNTGSFSGKEVIQVYVSLPQGRLEKEYRRLCAFGKTKLLAPDEQQTLTLTFSAMDMASYDEDASAWVLEKGVYGIFIGSSLQDALPAAALRLEEEKVLLKTKNICPQEKELKLLLCPKEITEKRYAELAETLGKVPEYKYDLSEVPAKAVDYSEISESDDAAAELTAKLTTDKLIAMVVGEPSQAFGSALGAAGLSVPGSAGETSSLVRDDGIASIIFADGPAGLRLNPFYYVKDGKAQMMPIEAGMEHGIFFDRTAHSGEEEYYQYCTAIPVGTLLAQSWNTELVEELGKMVADEMGIFGITLWLAPGMNIQRNPLCGRNFEYYSEDPFLSGKMAAAMTNGVQSRKGCGTTIKHYACNNREYNRMTSDSIISERALREIYLRGFGIAINESKPMSLMTSYNLVNGVHAANNADLCNTARREFGFDGMIMTDWTTTMFGVNCTAAGCMRAGNDLVMPGCEGDCGSIRSALEDGSLTEEQLRKCAARIVRTILRSDMYE